MLTCWSWARVMRMTEGNLALAAPAGIAGSLRCTDRGRCSAYWLLVGTVWGLGERRIWGFEV